MTVARGDEIDQLRSILQVSFDIEIVAKVGFAQGKIRGRQEHPPERPRPPQDQREARLEDGFRPSYRPIPEPQRKRTPRRYEKVLEYR